MVKFTKRRVALVTFPGALFLSACRAGMAGVPGAAPIAAASAAPIANAAGVAKARADSARYPYTAADIRFMSGMIGHHSQAIVMSRLAPSHGASASVRILAERIIGAQQDEIVTMQRWLVDRGQPLPATDGAPMAMGGDHTMTHDMSSMSHALMPGMLTADQMQQLGAARDKEFDRLFLTFMIQHHRGAVTMVTTLFDTEGAGQDELVFKFASDVNVDQTTEIARMEKMLATLSRN
jgi:uncharacterized protein (DUF305 family)